MGLRQSKRRYRPCGYIEKKMVFVQSEAAAPEGNMNYFDAHLHWFKDSAFGDRLAGALGGRPDIGYYEDKYRARGRLAGGIVMGNGPLEDQGRGLPEGFFYCLGLDEPDCVDHIGAFLPEIERHLESDRCVGFKIYPGYMPLFPHSPKMYGLYERLCSCGKVLAVHTGMMASLGGSSNMRIPSTWMTLRWTSRS